MAKASPEEAMTQEELSGITQPTRNAFTTLMTTKRKASHHSSNPSSLETTRKKSHPSKFTGRDGLGAYLQNPASYPPSTVIYHNPSFVAIHDLYPKSHIHTLLLPRSPDHNLLHPFDAFADPVFLSSVKEEVVKLEAIVVRELQRTLDRYSVQSVKREAVLNGGLDWPADEDLPAGRDWGKEVVSGIHAVPSMNHLHVHVMSRDRFSECVKHRKHYNSFATGFFVPLKDFPLADEDPRRQPGREGYLKKDFVCWRCGRGFGTKFQELKEHLEEEFHVWKRE